MGAQTRKLIVRTRWCRSRIAETVASSHVSAPSYGAAKDVGVVPIVESKTELRKVERQILSADTVICADHAALEQAPKIVDMRSVDVAAYILARTVPNELMREHWGQILIGIGFIGRNQINFVADHSAHESVQRRLVGVFDHLADNVSLPANRADNGNLIDCAFGVRTLLASMLVFEFAADIGFVHFDDAHQLSELRIVHRSAQAMAHIEGCAIRTRADHPMDLECANSLLASEHQVENVKPHAQRVFRVLENCLDRQREPIRVTLAAFWIGAFPVPRLRNRIDVILFAATRADCTVRPAPLSEIRAAGILIGKHPLKLADGHLRRELWVVLFVFRLHKNTIAQSYLSVKYRILAYAKLSLSARCHGRTAAGRFAARS